MFESAIHSENEIWRNNSVEPLTSSASPRSAVFMLPFTPPPCRFHSSLQTLRFLSSQVVLILTSHLLAELEPHMTHILTLIP